MKIQLREFYFDKSDTPKYRFFSIEEFVPENKYQRDFIKKLKILEQDPLFEKAVLDTRKNSGITSDFISKAIEVYDPYPLDLYLKEIKDEDKYYQLAKGGNDICLNFGLDAVSTFDLIFIDSIVIPQLSKPDISWIEPKDKRFPDLINGAVSILITRKIGSKTEFEEEMSEAWKKVERLMERFITPYDIAFPHIRNLDEYLKIYKLYREGLRYKQISEELRKENIYYEEATLRQIVKKVKDHFVKIPVRENNNGK